MPLARTGPGVSGAESLAPRWGSPPSPLPCRLCRARAAVRGTCDFGHGLSLATCLPTPQGRTGHALHERHGVQLAPILRHPGHALVRAGRRQEHAASTHAKARRSAWPALRLGTHHSSYHAAQRIVVFVPGRLAVNPPPPEIHRECSPSCLLSHTSLSNPPEMIYELCMIRHVFVL